MIVYDQGFSMPRTGSEKSLDVIGVASAISEASSFLLECWNRVRFHSVEKAEKNLKTFSLGLEVIEKINQNLKHGSINETEAEELKRDVMELIVVPKPSRLLTERRKISFVHISDDPNLYSVGDQGPSAHGGFYGTGVGWHPSARKRASNRKQPRKNAKSLRK
jgi:hypothetical protein